MCGITGIFSFKKNISNYESRISDAVSALKLRGPDSDGIYKHETILLGHTRLSIIDVSDNASQPFTDYTGRYSIVYNGEFFNFSEHRRKLIEKGYRFRSQSDTEVLLNLFIEEGIDFIHKVNGFFSFAIYDKQENQLFICRDRFGIKPLYYYYSEEIFAFASEMKALLALNIPKHIDNTSLFTYLQLNYIPAPHTILNGVYKLEPGHYINIKDNAFSIKKYYQLPITSDKTTHNLSYEESCVKLEQLLDDAVRMRLISDVPLGAFLSGGIDSSVIVALASRHTHRLNTFSIGYKDEPIFDETYYADIVSKKFKTNHTVFKLSNDDLFEHLYDVLNYTDEPFADSSALAVYILSKQTRKHVTVALSGDGADELFAGYNKHWAEYFCRNNTHLLYALSLAEPLFRLMPQSRNSFVLNKFRQLHRLSSGSQMQAHERYWHWCRYAKENDVHNLTVQKIAYTDYTKRKEHLLSHLLKDKTDMNDILYNDVHLILPNDMLTKVDLMSMANMLEVRVPFLDYRVAEFAFSLPPSFKIDSKARKKILKDAFKKELPSELYNRKKHGFEVPLLKWFKTQLKSMITDDLLENSFINEQKIFSPEEINKLKKQVFSNNPGDATARIWALIVFQFWYKRYFL